MRFVVAMDLGQEPSAGVVDHQPRTDEEQEKDEPADRDHEGKVRILGTFAGRMGGGWVGHTWLDAARRCGVMQG